MAGLRQMFTSSGVIIPSRSTKPDLLPPYAPLQSGEPSSSSSLSKAANKASQGHSIPYSRPEKITTPSGTGLRALGRSRRPSPSLGHAPDGAATSPHPPPRATKRQLVTHPGEEPAFASTSRRVSHVVHISLGVGKDFSSPTGSSPCGLGG
ncbi:hypothetical protein G5714_002742 [Onychostoma macrolepis]|uniref:Uncharacterized protein n=1 Tax=Onychostoma macrolepis TaxID=369639 RepID=A0A7J6D7K6_9TELE|nr:hypothetical protein G5714_002742 [Onychostoma macrolepis]